MSAKFIAKMHTEGMRLIAVIEHNVGCEVKAIQELMDSLNRVSQLSDLTED